MENLKFVGWRSRNRSLPKRIKTMRRIVPFESKLSKNKSVVVDSGGCKGKKGKGVVCGSEIDTEIFREKMHMPGFSSFCNVDIRTEAHTRSAMYWQFAAKHNPSEVNKMLAVEAGKALGKVQSKTCLVLGVGCR